MANPTDTSRTLRLSPEVLIGGYVDERKGKGAILVVRNVMAHLSTEMTRNAIAYLTACLERDTK